MSKSKRAFWLLVVGILSGILFYLFYNFVLVTAADLTNEQPSWYIGNGETNPFSNSTRWAYFYGKDGNFVKMTAREGTKGQYIWHPESVNDPEYIRSYSMQASKKNWTGLGYYVMQTGIATSTTYGSSIIHANGKSSDFMIVLRNGHTGRYYPLYPKAGTWEWKTLNGTSKAPDIANGETLFETPVEKGDTIFYITRPCGDNDSSYINLIPRIDLTDDSSAIHSYPEANAFTGWEEREADDSLYPLTLSFDVSNEKYQAENIRYGGLGRIAAVKREDGGTRLWATSVGGGTGEGPENFTLFYYSDDNGKTWSDAVMSLDYDSVNGRRNVRCTDHSLFYNEKTGKLWILYTTSTSWYDGRFVTYLTMVDNPGAADVGSLTWSTPRLLMDKHEVLYGVSNSRPTVLSDGTVLIPLWNEHYVPAGFAGENQKYVPSNIISERYQVTSVIEAAPDGTTFTRRGGTALSDPNARLFDETSIYQKDMSNPKELVMVSRVRAGLAAFESHDGGVTWADMDVNSNTFNFWDDNDGNLRGTSSNFVLQRLQSGNLLMVYYDDTTGNQNRVRVMARISTDNGETWSGGLLLGDGSYPYAAQSEDGMIHVVFDKTNREIHPRMYYTSFTEEDVLNGDSATEAEKSIICFYTGEPVYKSTRTMIHSGIYSAYSAELTSVDAHSRGEEDVAEFWYKYGSNYSFDNLELMGLDGTSPYWKNRVDTNRIGAWYMTASGSTDAALSWRSLVNANVSYSSSFGEIYLSGGRGSSDVMIVQKRGERYYPLWPVCGEFKWKTITDGEKAGLSDDGTLTTTVKPYDEIMVILRAGSSQITVNPTVSYTTIEADSSIVINHLEDSLFVNASGFEEKSTDISWYAQQSKQPWTGSNWTFEYFSLYEEAFVQLEKHISDDSPNFWESESGVVQVKGWKQRSDDKEYATVAFNAYEKGILRLSTTDGMIDGGTYAGQFMLLQRSGDQYHVLVDWINVPAGQSVTMPYVETYVKAGDVVYYMYRSSSHDWATMESTPKAVYVKGVEDTKNQYPVEWDALKDIFSNKFTGMTLSLDGKIGFNFYVNSNNTLSDDAYAEFVLPKSETQVVTKANAIETSTGLRFTCLVPAKEMADVIVVTLYDGGKALDTKSVSVRDYAEIIIRNETNNEAYAKATPLIKAMLHYGTYAQKLFEYNTGDLADKNYVSDDAVQNVESAQLVDFAKEKQGKEGFGSLAGATLVLEGETTLRMFFAFEDGVSLEGLKFTVNGVEQTYKISGNYYIVEFANITANKLDNMYTVTVTAGDHTFDATCSAMTFCYNALINSDHVALQDVAKALYLYNKEAKAYFN